jgi:quinol monooxygenase YgiN
MRIMIESSRSEDRCVEFCYAQDVLDSGLIHVKEVRRDRASLDQHFVSGHVADWRASWPGLGIKDRDLRAYEVGEPRRT